MSSVDEEQMQCRYRWIPVAVTVQPHCGSSGILLHI